MTNNLPAVLRSLATELEGTDYAFDEVCREAAAEIERLRAIVDAINRLRSADGDMVSIPNDNPDFGGPNTTIFVSRDFDEDRRKQYFGESLADCLTQAVRDREAAEAKGSTQ